MQAKLLRTLQELEVTRVGESRPRKVDFRLLSATNRDLEQESERGTFRSDLYYRVAAFPIRLPALRDRPEDIAPIAEALLGAACRRAGRRVAHLAPGAMEALRAYAWPGNVRELKNEIDRAVALADGAATIGLDLFSEKLRSPPRRTAPNETADPGETDAAGRLRGRTDEFERQEIVATLERHLGKKTPAARELGLTYQGLVKKMRRLGLLDGPS
jgi:transcriptional regulator with GAF, ATPase, and Fis domain